MGIIYKKEIDYVKTLGSLNRDESVVIPTTDRDIANIRAQVSKTSDKINKELQEEERMVFSVSKTDKGAEITRTS